MMKQILTYNEWSRALLTLQAIIQQNSVVKIGENTNVFQCNQNFEFRKKIWSLKTI